MLIIVDVTGKQCRGNGTVDYTHTVRTQEHGEKAKIIFRGCWVSHMSMVRDQVLSIADEHRGAPVVWHYHGLATAQS